MTINVNKPPAAVALEDQHGMISLPWLGWTTNVSELLNYRGLVLDIQDASASSYIAFRTGITSNFKRYEIDITNATWSAATTLLNLLVSTDRGATWKTGASDYAWGLRSILYSAAPAVETDANDTADTEITLLADNATNVSGNVFNGKIVIHHPADDSQTMVSWDLTYNGAASTLIIAKGVGQYVTGGIVNGIKLVPTSGTITTGRFVLTGFN